MKKAVAGLGFLLIISASLLIALPFVNIPRTVSEPYDIPESSIIITESFTVPPGTVTRSAYLNAGESVKIEATVTAGGNLDIDFYIKDASTTYVSVSRATTINKDWNAPYSREYNFIYDNSFSWLTSKDVTTQITKHWTRTAYRDVIQNSPLLQFEFIYGGIVLFIAGVAIAGFSSTIALSYEKRKAMKIRICPQCNQKISIDKKICPYCGYDVTKSVRCKHCGAIFSSSSYKCPHCGAMRK
jgi:RNA polymerase subunit RPABC4/transcription elongation factor Spt4